MHRQLAIATAEDKQSDHGYVRHLRCPHPPTFRLYCFPYAGGDADSIYGNWGGKLGPDVQISLVQLPGRGTRFRDAPVADASAAADEIAAALAQEHQGSGGIPYGFFGHSYGALLAYEVAQRLADDGPAFVFAAAREAPTSAGVQPPLSSLPKEQFWDALETRYGAVTPIEVLQNPDLRRIAVEATWSDVCANDQYRHHHEQPLTCPIYALMGLRDAAMPVQAYEGWSAHTSAEFALFRLPGDHYFVHSDQLFLFRYLVKGIAKADQTETDSLRSSPSGGAKRAG